MYIIIDLNENYLEIPKQEGVFTSAVEPCQEKPLSANTQQMLNPKTNLPQPPLPKNLKKNKEEDFDVDKRKHSFPLRIEEEDDEKEEETARRGGDVTPQFPGVPLTTRQPAEFLWVSGDSIPHCYSPFIGIHILKKITKSLLCSGSTTQYTTCIIV